MRLRVVTSPTGHHKVTGQNVRVTNADTGELVEGVTSMKIECNSRRSLLTIELVEFECDVVGEVES